MLTYERDTIEYFDEQNTPGYTTSFHDLKVLPNLEVKFTNQDIYKEFA
jgi:hypothetical protein